MSLSTEYIQRSVTGAVRLGFQDRNGLRILELTADGFFRSFYAILLAAPVYAFTLLGQMRITEVLVSDMAGGKSVTLGAYVLIHALNFFGGALLFLIAMIPLSRLLRLQPHYAAFVVAYNWGTLALSVIYVPITALFALGLIGAADAASLNLIGLGFALYYRFASFRTVLDAPWAAALSLAIIDLLLQWVWFLTLASLA